MKIAVVGGGPAAVAVVAAIHETRPDARVTLFSPDPLPPFPVPPPPPENPADTGYLEQLYRFLRKQDGLSFPPPKSLFGYHPDKIGVDGKKRVWASTAQGGLSQVWGASSLPLTDRELQNWPLCFGDLAPYYEKVAGMIGISGADDGLSDYFGTGFVNRPPTPLPEPFARLNRALSGQTTEGGGHFVSGIARLALETRPDHPNQCIACGGCMTGCSRGSVYVSTRDMDRLSAVGAIDHQVSATVLSFDPKTRTLTVRTKQGEETVAGFDHVYLAAGCLGTSEIVMRSLHISDGPVMQDNAVFTFPILSLGRRLPGAFPKNAQVLTNLVVGRISGSATGAFSQIQIYPSFNHLWRFYLPRWLWPVADRVGRLLEQHLLWGRLYLPGNSSTVYGLCLAQDNALQLTLKKERDGKAEVRSILGDLRRALRGSGFFIPPIGPLRHATSSHYAATFAYGNKLLDVPRSGEIVPGVYLCDASVFIESPSISPTFTIMANAWRTTTESLIS